MMKHMKVVLIIMQWDYLPLVDNKKEETFEYSISAFTAIRSSRIMTATPFFILEGSNGSTDIRILSDSQRQVYCNNRIELNTKMKQLVNFWSYLDNKCDGQFFMILKLCKL